MSSSGPDPRPGHPQARGARRAPRPLDPARLDELALAYVARFATSAAKLERYLHRKVRERGWEGENAPDVAAIVSRHTELGYVDDAAYARAKTGGLLRRGYGPRRVRQALGEAGIDEAMREDLAPGPSARRQAALALARNRGFGPFGRAPRAQAEWPKLREKQIAAMLRAGHMLDDARGLVDAQSEDAAEQWVAECDDES
jgi:regulatory protein